MGAGKMSTVWPTLLVIQIRYLKLTFVPFFAAAIAATFMLP